MKNKKRKIIILLGVIIIILLCIAFSSNIISIQKINENIRKGLYGDPINLDTGVINNEYFNINAERKKCFRNN